MKYPILLLLLLLIGCKSSTTESTQFNTGDWFSTLPKDSVSLSLLPIQSQISIYFTESIKEDGRSLSLIIQSKNIYPSGGYTIVSNVSRLGLNIDIIIDSIKAPLAGPGIFAPAYSTFEFGELPINLYNLKISINGGTVQGLLSVTDSSYNVKMQTNNIVYSSHPRILRVPKFTIWGQVGSLTSREQQLFIDSLKSIGAKQDSLIIGDYYYFEVISRDSFSTNSVIGSYYGQFYLLSYTGDIINTRNIVKRFAKRYQDTINIQLSGGRGERYYSTVLKYEP